MDINNGMRYREQIRIVRGLNYRTSVKIEDGLARAYQDYLSHRGHPA